jgi:cytochrome c oxidase subunit 2
MALVAELKNRVLNTGENTMRKMIQKAMRCFAAFLVAAMAVLVAGPVAASYDVNIPAPASPIALQIFDLHLGIIIVCIVIFVVVSGAMFYSLLKFRKSLGAKADVNFHENTLIEIIWTTIPFVILVGMAIPATRTVLAMKDASNPDITIKVTAYQWGWQYEYQQDGVAFYSNLSTPWSQIGQPGTSAEEKKGENYLLEVDNPMVVPAGKKVRLLVTSNDVIHGWYVPTLGINQYGIPGFIKDAWFRADKPGSYRGQCSQICGKLHGYMPITVVVKTDAEYAAWANEAKVKFPVPETAPPGAVKADAAVPKQVVAEQDPTKKYTIDELKKNGEKVYAANCVACHQPSGKGMPPAFPALDGSKVVTGPKNGQIALVLSGRPNTNMVSFARLSDAELASVITYTRNAWSNKAGEAIQPSEIKAARK